MSRPTPKYAEGDLVWLGEFDNGTEVIPRQKGKLLDGGYASGTKEQGYVIMYVVEVEYKYRDGPNDDGLRDVSEDQIEEVVTCKNHPDRRTVHEFDGDDLCQECVNDWVINEGNYE